MNDRHSHVIHDGYGKFFPVEKGFSDDGRTVTEGFIQSRPNIRRVADDDRPDRRPLSRRFDDHGQRKAPPNIIGYIIQALGREIIGEGSRRNTGALKSAFAHDLTHADGAGHDAGTRIGKAHHFAKPLQHAVFAVPAVQGVEYDVNIFFLKRLYQPLRHQFNSLYSVAFRRQRFGNGRAGIARYFCFRRRTADDDGNFFLFHRFYSSVHVFNLILLLPPSIVLPLYKCLRLPW